MKLNESIIVARKFSTLNTLTLNLKMVREQIILVKYAQNGFFINSFNTKYVSNFCLPVNLTQNYIQ